MFKRSAPTTLQRYVARVYMTRFLVVFVGIAVVLQALDLLAKSGEVLAGEGAGVSSLLRYMALRLPQIISELPPFTALLAALITFAALAQHSEITIMRASGMSAFRIVRPMMLASVVIAVAHFLFNELVVVDANVELDAWAANDYAVTTLEPPPPAVGAWAVDGNALIRVGAVTRGGTILDSVAIYERTPDAKLERIVNAEFAAYVDDRWTMFDVRTFTVADQKVTHLASEPWNTTVPPERFLALAVEPTKVSFAELWRTTRELQREGHPVAMLKSWLHQKIAGPAGSILMPLLGIIAGFGVVRSGLLFLRVALGMGLGFAFFIVDNLLLALGQFGTLPPFLAAWTPILLFLLIGFSVIIYTEE